MDYQKGFELLLPVIAWVLSAAMQKDTLSDAANTIIASTTVILCAVASAFFGGKLTGNVVNDVALISALAISIQATYFANLQQWLKQTLFPSHHE